MASDLLLEVDFATRNGDCLREKKVSTRFNCFHDIMLLREVIAVNPFCSRQMKRAWDNVAFNLSVYLPAVTSRCCRERTMRLLKLFKSNDRASLRRAGTELQYDEKEHLLQELKELEEDGAGWQEERTRVSSKRRPDAVQVTDVRSIERSSLENSTIEDDVAESSDSGFKIRKRKCRVSNIVEYLAKKQATEAMAKEKELQYRRDALELERRKIAIEERKIELEAERWKEEKDERREQQRMMMELFKMALLKE